MATMMKIKDFLYTRKVYIFLVVIMFYVTCNTLELQPEYTYESNQLIN